MEIVLKDIRNNILKNKSCYCDPYNQNDRIRTTKTERENLFEYSKRSCDLIEKQRWNEVIW